MNFLWVALGSALGGVCRYAVTLLVKSAGGFPWATLTVNVVGSLAIGVLSGALAHGGNSALRLFAVAGVCGGFTTFSTFSNDALRLAESAQWTAFAAYVVSSFAAGLAAVWLGYALAK